MKYLNNKDLNTRLSIKTLELEKLRLKAIFRNNKLPIPIRLLLTQKISLLSKKSSSCRVRNRCLITNRGKSVYNDFLLNRATLREFMAQDFIPGLRKSSW